MSEQEEKKSEQGATFGEVAGTIVVGVVAWSVLAKLFGGESEEKKAARQAEENKRAWHARKQREAQEREREYVRALAAGEDVCSACRTAHPSRCGTCRECLTGCYQDHGGYCSDHASTDDDDD